MTEDARGKIWLSMCEPFRSLVIIFYLDNIFEDVPLGECKEDADWINRAIFFNVIIDIDKAYKEKVLKI